MKTKLPQNNPVRCAAAMILAALCLASSAFAASGTWTNAPASGIWTNVANWNGGVAPGQVNNIANNGTDSSIATFTNAVTTYGGAANPILPDDGTILNGKARMMGQLNFDGPNCGAYVFYTSSAYQNRSATQPETGVISLCVPSSTVNTNGSFIGASVVNPQTFLMPVQIRLPSSTTGQYGFTNNATSPLATYYFKAIWLYPDATSRGVTFVLAGTNTGTNTIASLSQSAGQTGSPSGIRKEGSGRWILSGANTFNAGSPMNVWGGTLEVKDPGAFGATTTAVISNAVLQIDGVNLPQTSLTLKTGGTIQMNGSGTVNTVNAGTEAASVLTLATTSASDVLTVGSVTNGAVDGVIHVAGPGTVLLSVDSTVNCGTWSFDAGTNQLGSAQALGATPKTLAFGAGSTGVLHLNGYSVTALALTSNPTAGTPVVQNDSAAPATLTVSNALVNTFAGVLKDGAGGGALSLEKNNIGTLTLSGANTYSGNTTINLGTLNLAGSLGASAVTVASGGTLAGTGTANGSVDVQSGGILSPGNAAVGTLNVSSLTLESGSIQTIEFNNTPTNDLVNVTASGGLTINGGSLNLYQEGGILAFVTPGTYNLIKYTGTLNGSVANLSVANAQPGYLYTFGTAGGYVTLTITASSTSVIAAWNVDASGNWSAGANWTGGTAPHAAGDSATLGAGTALRTVTLDANETVGAVQFTNANSFVITGGNTLTLDNGGSPTAISTLGGTANAIQTAVALNDVVTMTVNNGKSLAISGTIANGGNGAKAMTIAGSGTLSLTGNNSYGPAAGTVGTTVNGGATVQLGNSDALGAGDVDMAVSGTLQANAAGMNVPNNLAVAALATATVDNNGNNLTLSGFITGSGDLTKTGNGQLTLGSGNSYFGKTTVNGGILAISDDSSLGAAPGIETANSILLNGGRLLGTGTISLSNTRDIGIGSAAGAAGTNAVIDAAAGQSFTIAGSIASAGNTGVNGLIVNQGAGDTGTVILSGANTFNGPTYIARGALQLENSLALQNSVLDYTNGTLLFGGGISAATIANLMGTQNLSLTNIYGTGVALTLGGDNGSVTYPANFDDAGVLSGAGSLIKTGTGTLTLAGTNTLSGNVGTGTGVLLVPTNGISRVGSVSVSGTSGPQLVVNGGALVVTNASTIVNGGGGALGTLLVSSGSAVFYGNLSVNAGGSQSSVSSLISVTGGSLTASNLTLGRGGLTTTTQPASGQTGQGLYINGGTVDITTNISMGTMGGANSGTSLRMDSGSLTVGGSLTFGHNNSGRWSVVDISGGTLTVNDTATGINIGSSQSGNAELLIRGGTTFAGKIGLGNSAYIATNVETAALNQTNGSLYIGAGGIVQNGDSSNTAPAITFGGGIVGATADWVCTNGMTLGSATIQAADAGGAAHNITLTGTIGGGGMTKTGSGILTLTAGNFFTNGVILKAGTLNINGSWALGGAVYGGFTFSGGTLQYAPAFSGNGPGDITANTAATPVQQPVTFNTNAIIDVNGNTVTYAYGVGNGGSGGLIVESSIGGGILNLQGTNSYTGNTTVNSGSTLELGLPTIPKNSTVTVNAGGVLKLDFAGGNEVTNIVLGGVTHNAPGTYNNNNSAPYITGIGSLVIPSPIAGYPTNITAVVNGGNLEITWPATHLGWMIQAQTNPLTVGLSTNWITISNTAGTLGYTNTFDPSGAVFYRLSKP